MQENPTANPAVWAIVWPTIAFRCSDPWVKWWSFCKGLALQDGASPWRCHTNALEFYCRYPTIVDVPISIDISQRPSTVVIEEMESDESYDGSSASSASGSMSVEVPSTIVIVGEEENDEAFLSICD